MDMITQCPVLNGKYHLLLFLFSILYTAHSTSLAQLLFPPVFSLALQPVALTFPLCACISLFLIIENSSPIQASPSEGSRTQVSES